MKRNEHRFRYYDKMVLNGRPESTIMSAIFVSSNSYQLCLSSSASLLRTGVWILPSITFLVSGNLFHLSPVKLVSWGMAPVQTLYSPRRIIRSYMNCCHWNPCLFICLFVLRGVILSSFLTSLCLNQIIVFLLEFDYFIPMV